MKQKQFYWSLVETTDITLELGEIDLTPEERIHLLSLVDANIHSAVINTVLSELSNENKKIFLNNLASDDHDITWKHLRKETKNLDGKIIKAVSALKKEFLNDIKKERKLSKIKTRI